MIATVLRVLSQLRHDKRTLAMIFLLPCALLALLWWVYDGSATFDRIGPALLALFPLVVMFMVTSITMLRERRGGTLERLLTLPLSKGALVGGYALAFGVLAIGQALLASALLLWPLGLKTAGPAWMLVLVAVVDALLGMSLGLFVSAFARTEFQAIQFFPAIVLPQFLLCGLLVPRDQMPRVLEWVSNALPLSYAVDAMQAIALHASPGIWGDVAVIALFAVAMLTLGAATLRRRTA